MSKPYNFEDEVNKWANPMGLKYDPDGDRGTSKSAPPTQPPIPDGELREAYPEFSKFLQDCHDNVAATYTDKEKGQILYNKQAFDLAIQADRDRLYTALEAAKHVYNVRSTDAVLNEPNTGVVAVPIEAINKVFNRNGAKHE